MRYRLLSGSHGRFEDGQSVRYVKGDEIDLSPTEAESLGRRVEKVVGAKPERATEPAKAVKPLGLDSLHWVRAAAKVSKLDTVEALDAAEVEEKDGRDRKGVHDAIEARREEVAG